VINIASIDGIFVNPLKSYSVAEQGACRWGGSARPKPLRSMAASSMPIRKTKGWWNR
jgi:hypothetical protein